MASPPVAEGAAPASDGVRLATTGAFVASVADGSVLSFASGLSILVKPSGAGAASARVVVAAGKSEATTRGMRIRSAPADPSNPPAFDGPSDEIRITGTGDIAAEAPTMTIKSDWGYKKAGKIFTESQVLKQITWGAYMDIFLGIGNAFYLVSKYDLLMIANRESLKDLTMVVTSTFNGLQKVEQWGWKTENNAVEAENAGARFKLKTTSRSENAMKKKQALAKLKKTALDRFESELDSSIGTLRLQLAQFLDLD